MLVSKLHLHSFKSCRMHLSESHVGYQMYVSNVGGYKMSANTHRLQHQSIEMIITYKPHLSNAACVCNGREYALMLHVIHPCSIKSHLTLAQAQVTSLSVDEFVFYKWPMSGQRRIE